MDINTLKRRAGILIEEDIQTTSRGKLQFSNVIKVHKLDYTADDWQLYDQEGRDKVASLLNQALMGAINSGAGALEITQGMEKAMYRLRDMGASDTEPRSVMNDILGKVGIDVYMLDDY